jgi:pimeloyl-ACP methyl ester carboxylesterase
MKTHATHFAAFGYPASGRTMRSALLLIVFLAHLIASDPIRAADPSGYHPKVKVSAPTRLDWIFALANQSLAEPPADWLKDYDSTSTEYELFVPPGGGKKPLALVLFISPGQQPAGWAQWGGVCRKNGIVFASPLAAGNNCPMQRRVRIVLDVLDDVRRQVAMDPDRTYIGGFSGGGRIASSIAFALPELFGGVASVCAGAELRDESWLRQRAVDRLSVALVTGENDFNRGEIERWRGPLLSEVGVRTKVWTVPKLGHGIPDERVLAEVFRWLEDGASQRSKFAKEWPTSRIAQGDAPTPEQWSQSLFKEAQTRLGKKETLFSGLMQLQGISARWSDLPAAAAAKKILLECDARMQRSWEQEDIAEQRRFLIAGARSLDAYASGDLPAQYLKQRPAMARAALEMWEQIQADQPDSPSGQEAARRIPQLRKLAGEK